MLKIYVVSWFFFQSSDEKHIFALGVYTPEMVAQKNLCKPKKRSGENKSASLSLRNGKHMSSARTGSTFEVIRPPSERQLALVIAQEQRFHEHVLGSPAAISIFVTVTFQQTASFIVFLCLEFSAWVTQGHIQIHVECIACLTSTVEAHLQEATFGMKAGLQQSWTNVQNRRERRDTVFVSTFITTTWNKLSSYQYS